MKRLIALGVVLVTCTAIYLISTSGKRSYINGLPEYVALAGREFIFERPCYIFKSRTHESQYPLVGANVPNLPVSVSSLPVEVSDKHIGEKNDSVKILATVRVGDRFKIVSVRRDDSRSSFRISFEILFADEADRPYPRLDAYFIMDHTGEMEGKPVSILSEFAVQKPRF